MDVSHLFQNYTKYFISSHILKSPYHEIYHTLFNNNPNDTTFLIINQGIYIPFYSHFPIIHKKEYHITYVDDNELSLRELNNDILKYKNETQISVDHQIERFQSHIFDLQKSRFKDIYYDCIIIHHYNHFLDKKDHFFNILKNVTKKGSEILLFASVSSDSNVQYKNNIRKHISNYTNMKIGNLLSLEELILTIPQNDFKIKHILPYRESQYLGYGKNIIYKLIIQKE